MSLSKTAQSAVMLGLILGGIFMVVTISLFANKAAIFSSTLSITQLKDQNEACRALTYSGISKSSSFEDLDGDNLADICDPCPNNHLSERDEDINTDNDGDGLSEEGLELEIGRRIRSRFAREYPISLCDREIAPKRRPDCYAGWDGVRQKCRCGVLLNDQKLGGGFIKDRCATEEEWLALKSEFYQPEIKQMLKDIHDKYLKNLKFKEGVKVWKDAQDKLKKSQNIEVGSSFMNTVEFLASALEGKQVDQRVLETITKETIDTRLADPDFEVALKAIAWVKLSQFKDTYPVKIALFSQAERLMAVVEEKYPVVMEFIKKNRIVTIGELVQKGRFDEAVGRWQEIEQDSEAIKAFKTILTLFSRESLTESEFKSFLVISEQKYDTLSVDPSLSDLMRGLAFMKLSSYEGNQFPKGREFGINAENFIRKAGEYPELLAQIEKNSKALLFKRGREIKNIDLFSKPTTPKIWMSDGSHFTLIGVGKTTIIWNPSPEQKEQQPISLDSSRTVDAQVIKTIVTYLEDYCLQPIKKCEELPIQLDSRFVGLIQVPYSL